MRVYVGAPYGAAGRVKDVHGLLRSIGCEPTSHWAEFATSEVEILKDSSARQHRAQWHINQDCLDSSEAMLVLSEPTGGAELFAEVGRALCIGRPVLWTGPRRILSCYAPGMVVLQSVSDALDRLAGAAKVPRESRRDVLLAGFQGRGHILCPRCGHDDVRSTAFSGDGSLAWKCHRCDAMFPRTTPKTDSAS